MTGSALIDTNILVRHFVRDIPDQADQATQVQENLDESGPRGYVPSTVVLELVFTWERQYRIDRNRIAEAIVELLRFPGLDVEHASTIVRALDAYRDRRSVSFADALHCELARSYCDGVVVSFDQALSRVPGIQRIEPARDQISVWYSV